MGRFREKISGQQQIQGSIFRVHTISSMLANAFILDPVNVFLYTWQFLPTLETEESNTTMSKIYRWYRKISIWIVPAAFVGIFVALEIVYGRVYQYYLTGNAVEGFYWFNISVALIKTVGYMTTIVNFISCAILLLTIRHAYKQTQQSAEFDIENERQLNTIVTVSHVTIILGSTITAFFKDNIFTGLTLQAYRLLSSLFFVTAL
jgi:hypothetical protein